MIRALFADLLAYFIVPAAIALMPARFGMRLSRWLVHNTPLHDADAVTVWAHAAPLQPEANAGQWKFRHRLVRLRDHVDLYVWLLRGRGWYRDLVRIEGVWPGRPAVVVTFHWGCGLWALHSLREATGGFAGVAAPPPWAALKHRPMLFLYARLRTWVTMRILGDGLVYPGGAARHLMQALVRGKSICGLYDSPKQGNEKTLTVNVIGRSLALPRGLPAMAVGRKVPLVVFSAEPDMLTGGTVLRISEAEIFESEQAAADHLANELALLIAHEPANWHHWYLCST
jgi:phosphatidylinositol dimannoside acyltransferase